LADLFAREHLAVDLIHAHQDGISFAVENKPALSSVLRKIDENISITVQEGCAGIRLVGEGVAQVPSTLARAAAALQGCGLRLCSKGSSPLSLGLVVDEEHLPDALESLHREFFAAPDPAVFDLTATSAPRQSQATARTNPLLRPGQPQPSPAH